MLNKSQVINYLSSDIEKLKKYYSNSESSKSKKIIEEKLLLMEIKKIAVGSSCPYIIDAYEILKSENRYDIKRALIYLKKSSTDIKASNIHYYRTVLALIYDILDKKIEAYKEYKSALKYKFNRDTLNLYREFIDRVKQKEIKEQKRAKIKDIDIESLSKSAKSLEAIAKKYTKSYKSLKLAQKYYMHALDIHKQLLDTKIVKHRQNYILALIKAVETYSLPKELLKEAESLIFFSRDSQDTEQYLLNKIKALKGLN